jgi:hypothetical protein
MTDHDIALWSLVATGIATIIAIIATILAFVSNRIAARARREANAAAVAQGTFDSPKLKGFLISEQCPSYMILATHIVDGRVNELPMTFYLRNVGTKVAEHITVYIRIPSELTYGNSLQVSKSFAEVAELYNVTATLLREERFGTIALSVPRLQPYEKLAVAIPLSVRGSTEVKSKVEAKSSDGIDISLDIYAQFYYVLDIFTACEGTQPETFQYKMEILDTSKSPLADSIVDRNTGAKRDYESRERHLGFWSRAKERVKLFVGPTPGLRKIMIVEFREDNKSLDARLPIARYSKATLYEGVVDIRRGTYWIPSLGTEFP